MKRKLTSVLLAAVVAVPATAFAADDCETTSRWREGEKNNKPLKVEITFKNKSDSTMAAEVDWGASWKDKGVEGSASGDSPRKAMSNGQSTKTVLHVKDLPKNVRVDFKTVFTTNKNDAGQIVKDDNGKVVMHEYGTARFQVRRRDWDETKFWPGSTASSIKCDRKFGENANVWKVEYTLNKIYRD